MKKLALSILALGLTSTALATRTFASQSAPPAQSSQYSQSAQPVDKTAPSYDMKAQSVLDLQQMQQKFVSLAEAIPADKYTWRPGEGARSISELLLHVAGAGYFFPTMMGTPPAPDFKGDGFEKSTTDKAKVIEQLNKAFAYSIASVQAMTNGNFADPQKKLGPDANSGDVVYLLVVDAHEHLGQFIAYARSNGIVPPWTVAAAEAAAKRKAAEQKQ
ncbi:MAG: DinB family protein [Candidatus Acidiferrales bacterium]